MVSLPTQIGPLTALYDVMRFNAPRLTRTQVLGWNKLNTFTIPLGTTQTLSQSQEVYLGLFGHDLHDLLADCAMATQTCKVTDYQRFDGWAIGAAIFQNTVPTFTYASASPKCNVGGVVTSP